VKGEVRRIGARAGVGLLGALLVVVAAGSPARAAELPTLTVAIDAPVVSLNPFTATDASSQRVLGLMYDALVDYGPDNQPTSGVADSWQVAASGVQWTYTIPAGRQWSDGEAITAKDVVFTFEALMDDAALPAARRAQVANVASVSATDANTVVVTLDQPQATNPGLGLLVVPQRVWGDVGKVDAVANDPASGPLVGSGPFIVTGKRADGGVDLRTNVLFWRGVPKIGGVSLVPYADTAAAVTALTSGDVDLVSGLTPAQATQLKSAADVTTQQGVGRTVVMLHLNPGQSTGTANPLATLAVRQAIASALDLNSLVTDVFAGAATPGVTNVPPAYPWLSGLPSGTKARATGVSAALATLTAAMPSLGYGQDTQSGEWLGKDGKPLSLRLFVAQGDPETAATADWVAAALKAIGLSVTVTPMTAETLSQAVGDGAYDMYLDAEQVSPDPDQALAPYRCGTADGAATPTQVGPMGWCDAQFEALYAAQHVLQSTDDRADEVKQAYGLVYQADFAIALAYPDVLEAWRGDQFASFTRVPADSGPVFDQLSYWGLFGAVPVRPDQPSGTTVVEVGGQQYAIGKLVAGGVGLVAAVLLVTVVLVRRRIRRGELGPDDDAPVTSIDESAPHVGDFEDDV